MYNIEKLLNIKRKKKKEENRWNEVEKELGIHFPEDYKLFIDNYGEGGINEFLWILSPFSLNNNLNSISKFNEMKNAYQSMKFHVGENFLYDFYDGEKGLFPWGITDNGDELYWVFEKGTVEILVIASRYTDNVIFSMKMTELLCRILNRDIICSFFPDDFLLEMNYYKVIPTEKGDN